MENLDPSFPPNQGWENGAFLPFARLPPWFGGDGGLLFHFILFKIVTSHADVLRGSSRVPDEPLRTSAWEPTIIQNPGHGYGLLSGLK